MGILNEKVVVFLFCYNEEFIIGKVIDDFKKELLNVDIYVYDNNFKDKIFEIVKDYGVIVWKEMC